MFRLQRRLNATTPSETKNRGSGAQIHPSFTRHLESGLIARSGVSISAETKKWKAVRVLDCSDLAEWLDSVPAVAFWVARLIGKRPANVCDLTVHWDNIRDLSEPKLRPEVLLAGRAHELKAIEAWLEQDPSPLYVEVESREELIDFFAAFALSQPADNRAAEARAVIIETREAWRILCASTSPLILIPACEIDPQLVSEAVRFNHHVLVPTPIGGCQTRNPLLLRRLSILELEQALIKAQFNPRHAKRVAMESGGTSIVLKRTIGSGAPKLPPWAASSVAPKLAPFLLVGSWTDDKDSGADIEAVTRITGMSEAEIQATAQQWSRGSDALFYKRERTWRLVSRADSWRWLAGYLNQQNADSFASQFHQVVAIDDPRFELEPEKRIMAHILGKKLKYSPAIRKGMIEAFALLAMSSERLHRYSARTSYNEVMGTARCGVSRWHRLAKMGLVERQSHVDRRSYARNPSWRFSTANSAKTRRHLPGYSSKPISWGEARQQA